MQVLSRCMGRIAITDGMAEVAKEFIRKSGHEVISQHFTKEELEQGVLSEFDAVIIRSATKLTQEVINASIGGNLKAIGRAGVGTDNIDIDSASKNGIFVLNTPSASTQSVVELTISHLLSCVRKMPYATHSIRQGKWEKKSLKGSELSGKNLGFIGFGRIAQGVAKVAKSIGMDLHAYDPYLPRKIAKSYDCVLHSKVEDVFRICTHITIHCQHNSETHHLVNSEMISKMPSIGADGTKCGNHIVNCARGGIVDEDDLLIALKSGQLASAALDVFEEEPVSADNPLLLHPNFHGTPHIGAVTMEAQSRVGIDISKSICELLEGKMPTSIINSDISV